MLDINEIRTHFYPRSPCGERLYQPAEKSKILYFYPRSPCGERRYQSDHPRASPEISIHALLAESDPTHPADVACGDRFLSTLSLRRATSSQPTAAICQSYFYPRSPCGERQRPYYPQSRPLLFLSTLSLRRATVSSVLPGFAKRLFLSTLSLRRATICL